VGWTRGQRADAGPLPTLPPVGPGPGPPQPAR
jgi:hypothetical protein